MNTKETGGPAFPVFVESGNNDPDFNGMTLRQYAAIKLKVPDGSTDWLDEMITASLRDELASKAMQGFFSSQPPTMGEINQKGFVNVAQFYSWAAYEYADAMLKAREL